MRRVQVGVIVLGMLLALLAPAATALGAGDATQIQVALGSPTVAWGGGTAVTATPVDDLGQPATTGPGGVPLDGRTLYLYIERVSGTTVIPATITGGVANWTGIGSDLAGAQQLNISDANLGGTPTLEGTATLAVAPPAGTTFEVSTGTATTSPDSPVTVTVTAKDAGGNATPLNALIDLQFPGSLGTIHESNFSATTTAGQPKMVGGALTVDVSFSEVGTHTISAVDGAGTTGQTTLEVVAALTGGSFTTDPWLYSKGAAPSVHLSVTPPTGATKMAYGLTHDLPFETIAFADSDFVSVAAEASFVAPAEFAYLEGSARVWMQFADDTGAKTALSYLAVPVYAGSHITLTDAMGNGYNSFLTGAEDKALTATLLMGSYGAAVPGAGTGTWTLTVTDLTNGAVTAPAAIDATTGEAAVVIPAAYLQAPKTLKVSVLRDGAVFTTRNVGVVDSARYGLIQVGVSGLAGNTIAWLAATDVNKSASWAVSFTKLPASIYAEAGTYRLEVQVWDDAEQAYLLYPAGEVTVTPGSAVQAAVSATTVPVAFTNTANVGGTPLVSETVQLRPAGAGGRARLSADISPYRSYFVTPGSYDVLFSLQTSESEATNHVYMKVASGVDVSAGVDIGDDFGDSSHATLRLTGTDGKGGAANVHFFLSDFNLGWGSDAPGYTDITMPKGTYEALLRVSSYPSDSPYLLYGSETIDLSASTTVAIGGPLSLGVTVTGLEPGSIGSVAVAVKDSAGRSLVGGFGAIALTAYDATGAQVASLPYAVLGDNPISIPETATLPIRVRVTTDLGVYQGVISRDSYYPAPPSPPPTPYVPAPVVGDPAPADPAPAPEFSDLDEVDWAKDDIEVLAAKGVIEGTGDGRFKPNNPVTRAEFVTFLVRALGLEGADGLASFQDVADSDWFAQYVHEAAQAGIVKGADGNFNPNAAVTREEMAVMLVRALTYRGESLGLTPEEIDLILASFDDGQALGDWAKEAAAAAVSIGLVKGRGEGQLAPKGQATRAEAVVVLRRLLGYTGDL